MKLQRLSREDIEYVAINACEKGGKVLVTRFPFILANFIEKVSDEAAERFRQGEDTPQLIRSLDNMGNPVTYATDRTVVAFTVIIFYLPLIGGKRVKEYVTVNRLVNSAGGTGVVVERPETENADESS